MEDCTKTFELFGQLRKITMELLEEESNCQNSMVVDLRKLEHREKIITKMTELHTALNIYSRELHDKITNYKKQHEDDLQRMGDFLRSKKIVKDESINTQVAPKRILGRQAVFPPPGFAQMAPIEPSLHPKYSKVPITDTHHLMAIRVPTFAEATLNGELYYVESANHFAFKIAGVFFHGNIGNIYTNERDPLRVKNCKYRNTCVNKDCSFYHDPLINPGSKDVRNFTASSWVYASPHYSPKNHKLSRRFGSRENIEVDLPLLTDDEVTRMRDQTVHDVLCVMLLNRYHESKI